MLDDDRLAADEVSAKPIALCQRRPTQATTTDSSPTAVSSRKKTCQSRFFKSIKRFQPMCKPPLSEKSAPVA